MPTRTARPTRTPAPRRPTGRRANANTSRRGLAGGWLQRRQPEPSRKRKAAAAAKTALPGAKGAMAAAGLAVAGAVGVLLRKRSGDNHAPEPTTPVATTPVSPPVKATPTEVRSATPPTL